MSLWSDICEDNNKSYILTHATEYFDIINVYIYVYICVLGL